MKEDQEDWTSVAILRPTLEAVKERADKNDRSVARELQLILAKALNLKTVEVSA